MLHYNHYLGRPEFRVPHPRDISLRHQRTSAIFPRITWGLGRHHCPNHSSFPQNSPCPLPYHGHIPHCSIVDIFAYNKCPKWRIFDANPVKWSNIVGNPASWTFLLIFRLSHMHGIYHVFEASMICFFSLCPYVLWFLLHLAGHFVHLCFSKSASVLRWCVVKLWCHDNLRWPCFLLGCFDLWKDVASNAFRKFFTGVASRACWNIHAKVRA